MNDLDVGYRVGPLDQEALNAASARRPADERHLDEPAFQEDVLGSGTQRIMCGKPARGPAYVHEVRRPALGDFSLQFFVTGNAEIGGVTGRKEIARRDYIRCGVLRKHDARSLGHGQYRSIRTPRFYRTWVKFA
jgi:hypothetical protein